jgi:hypothetical protein
MALPTRESSDRFSPAWATAIGALAAAGTLGVLLKRQERAAAEEHERLARRAAIVERQVPRRRARVDRIVIHV